MPYEVAQGSGRQGAGHPSGQIWLPSLTLNRQPYKTNFQLQGYRAPSYHPTAQTTEFASRNGKVKKVITVRLSELSDDPRKYQLPQSVVLTKQFGFWRKEYTLYASYLTNALYLIQDLASIFEAHGVKCKISSFTEPERGRNVYNLWVRTKSHVRVEYIPSLSSICSSCVNLETRREGTLWRCRRIDLMERELGEKAALLQVEATFRGELQKCNYFKQGPGRLLVG